MRGGSIDLFDPKLEGLHQEAVHIFTCDLLFVSQSLLLIDFKFSSWNVFRMLIQFKWLILHAVI